MTITEVMTREQILDAALWLQQDSAWLYACARSYRDSGLLGSLWLATMVQNNAAHSAALARTYLDQLTTT